MRNNWKGTRALLNQKGHHSTAAIVAEWEDDNTYRSVQISDCDRKINLDFELGSQECYENSLYKIDVMIKALQMFRKGLIVTGRKKGFHA